MKLLFLLLPLAINVKAVEIINKSYGPSSTEPTWYETSEEYMSTPSVTPYYLSSTPSTKLLVEESPESNEDIQILEKVSPVPLRLVAKPVTYESVRVPEIISEEIHPVAASYVSTPVEKVHVLEKASVKPISIETVQLPEIISTVQPVTETYVSEPDNEVNFLEKVSTVPLRVVARPITIESVRLPEVTNTIEPVKETGARLYVTSPITNEVSVSKKETVLPAVVHIKPQHEIRWYGNVNPTSTQYELNEPENRVEKLSATKVMTQFESAPSADKYRIVENAARVPDRSLPKTAETIVFSKEATNQPPYRELPRYESTEMKSAITTIQAPKTEINYSETYSAVPLRSVPKQAESISKSRENYQQRVTYIDEEVKSSTKPHYQEHSQNYHITTSTPKFTSPEISRSSFEETYSEKVSGVPLRSVPKQATEPDFKPTERYQQRVTYAEDVSVPTRTRYTEYHQNAMPNFSTAKFEIKGNDSPIPLRRVPEQVAGSVSVKTERGHVNLAKAETSHYTERIKKEFVEDKPREIKLVESDSPVPVRVVSKPLLVETVTMEPTTIAEPREVIEVLSTTSLPVTEDDVYITKSSIMRQYNPTEVILQEGDSPSKYHLRLDFTCETGIHAYYSVARNCDKFVECKDDIPKLYRCPSGQHFNRKAVWPSAPCGDPSVVGCDSSIIVTTAPPKPKPFIIALQIIGYSCGAPNGYHKVEDNCEQFVQCKQFVASLYGCPAGLQYNINTPFGENPCDVPSVAQCSVTHKFSAVRISERLVEFSCPSSHGYFKFANDCEKFIKCEHSQPTSYKCLPGLQFNHNALWGHDPCASESVIRCRNTELVIPPAPKFSAYLILRLQDFDCPSSHGYYRVDNNCDEFIRCERSMASKYRCWSGLHYNHNAPWGDDPCASPSIARCEVTVRPTFSATLVSTRVVGFTCPTSTGYFQSDNCEMFIQCKDLAAAWYKCNSGLQFNSKAAFGEDPCAVPAVARCVTHVIHEVDFVNPAILISDHIGYYTCKANGYNAIENNCEEFIQCKRNVASLYKCPAGLQFNPNAHWGENPCASESTVRCQVKTLSYFLVIKHMSDYTCANSNGYYKVEDQCEEFVECRNYVPSMYKCKNGLHFNRYVAWGADPCAAPAIAGCVRQNGKRPQGAMEMDSLCLRAAGRFPLDTMECSKYVVCENGVATIMPCPPGLVFNATLEACDWPVNVPSCNPDIFHGFQCPAPHSVKEDGSPSEEITHFRYNESCQNYIACQDGRPRFLSCDPGLYFDEQTSHCVDSSLINDCKSS